MGAEAVPHLIYARQLEAAAAVGEAVQPQENVETEAAPEQPQEAKAEDADNADKPLPPPTFYCFSCSSQVHVVEDPRTQSNEPGSSTQMPYAITLNCPCAHIFCTPCMGLYINSKLNDAKEGKKAFPVRCPECWMYGFNLDDSVIEKVVGVDTFEEWKHWKLLDGISKMYCPNPRCSEVLQVPDKDCHVLESSCPACGFSMCVSCRSPWHHGMTCMKWLKSPESLNLEDLHVRKMAKKHRWRRCPSCKVVVEKTEGCNHMACRCGHHYCNQCGSEWINGCSNPGGCKRWQADDSLYAPGRVKIFMRETTKFFTESPPRMKRSFSNATLKLGRSLSRSDRSTGPLSPTSDVTEDSLPEAEEAPRPTWRRRATTISFSWVRPAN